MLNDILLWLRCKAMKKLHIGNGSIALNVNMPLARLDNDEVIIPGSTIRGVLRTCMIRVAHLLGYDIKNISVYPTKIKEDDLITSLMGRPDGYRSKVMIYPVLLRNVQPLILTHIAIDDRLGTAKEGSLFTVEYIQYETEFDVRIDAHDITLDEARLLFLAIVEMSYERIGRGGIIDVYIQKSKSHIPDEIKNDKIVSEVLRCKSI